MGGFNTSVAQPSPVALDIKPPQSQSPLEILSQMQQIKAGQQQLQTQQMQQQEMQMNLSQRQAINQAYQQAFTPQPDGSMQLDDTKLTSALATAGHGEAIPGIMENLTKYRQSLSSLQETNQKVTAAEADAAGNLGATVKAANNDPTLFHTLLTDAINRKIIQPAHYAPLDQMLQQSLQQDPTGAQARGLVGQFTDQMIAGSPKQQELATAKTAAEARNTTAQTGQTKETREAGQQQFQNAVSDLGANPPQSAAEYQARIGKLPPAVATRILAAVPASQYDPANSGPVLQKLGMTPDQQAITQNASATLAETVKRDAQTQQHSLADESIRRITAGVEQGRLAQEQLVNGLKYGPGTTEYWVKQLQDNPDSVKEMPPELRSTVGQGFRAATGLPLPTPVSQTGQTQETAARNALDGAAYIKQALQNPEIRSQLGPIMGRLGNAEQSVGTAVGLSPEAAQLAQELRTRMRYFVFQEGKAVLGGRLPQQLMSAMEQSSASVKMDPNLLLGAVNGAVNNAQSILDNNDKQRFGGQMRPRSMRMGNIGAPTSSQAPAASGPLPQGAGKVIDQATALQFYKAAGNDPAKARQLATQNGWKVQ